MRALISLSIILLVFTFSGTGQIAGTVEGFNEELFTVSTDTILYDQEQNRVTASYFIFGHTLDSVLLYADQYYFVGQARMKEKVSGVWQNDWNFGVQNQVVIQELTDTSWWFSYPFDVDPITDSAYIQPGCGITAIVWNPASQTATEFFWSAPADTVVSLNNLVTNVSTQSQKLLEVFPNPTRGTLVISSGLDNATIFNSIGEKVMVVPVNQPVDISSLNPGVYYVNRKKKILKIQ